MKVVVGVVVFITVLFVAVLFWLNNNSCGGEPECFALAGGLVDASETEIFLEGIAAIRVVTEKRPLLLLWLLTRETCGESRCSEGGAMVGRSTM